jgi:hypothetical protein
MKDKNKSTEVYVTMIEKNLETIKGELYKLEHDNRKIAGKEIRKAIMNILNVCKPFRKLIIEVVKQIEPRSKWTKKSIKSMLAKKKATEDAKKNK